MYKKLLKWSHAGGHAHFLFYKWIVYIYIYIYIYIENLTNIQNYYNNMLQTWSRFLTHKQNTSVPALLKLVVT